MLSAFLQDMVTGELRIFFFEIRIQIEPTVLRSEGGFTTTSKLLDDQ